MQTPKDKLDMYRTARIKKSDDPYDFVGLTYFDRTFGQYLCVNKTGQHVLICLNNLCDFCL